MAEEASRLRSPEICERNYADGTKKESECNNHAKGHKIVKETQDTKGTLKEHEINSFVKYGLLLVWTFSLLV